MRVAGRAKGGGFRHANYRSIEVREDPRTGNGPLWETGIPVLFLIYNRPSHTRTVFSRLREIKPRRLYIAADGPKVGDATDQRNCAATRSVVADVDWDCNIYRSYADHNQGCKKAVSGGLRWFFENEVQGIILEDDCLPARPFFDYCARLLDRYRDDPQVISINGNNLGFNAEGHWAYTFSRFMNMWGWATWRRAALLVDYDLTSWGTMASKVQLFKRLNPRGGKIDFAWYIYWRNILDRVKTGELDTWDYQWMYTSFTYSMLSVVPSTNLIQNIGFGDGATHTKDATTQLSRAVAAEIDEDHNYYVSPHGYPVLDRYEADVIKKVYCSYRADPRSQVMSFLKTFIENRTVIRLLDRLYLFAMTCCTRAAARRRSS